MSGATKLYEQSAFPILAEPDVRLCPGGARLSQRAIFGWFRMMPAASSTTRPSAGIDGI